MAAKGFNCTLAFGGTTVGKARNVDPTFEGDEQDITVRDDSGWDNWQQGRRRMTADLEVLWVPTNEGVQTIRDAWLNDSNLSFTMLDENGYGFSGTCGVLNFKMGPQDLDNAVMMSVSIKSRGVVSKMPAGS